MQDPVLSYGHCEGVARSNPIAEAKQRDCCHEKVQAKNTLHPSFARSFSSLSAPAYPVLEKLVPGGIAAVSLRA
jgi:hypothetical protein